MTAVITGATGGIGESIARSLASEGYNIVLNYNTNEEGSIKLENELRELGVEVLRVKADISSEDEVKNLVEKAIDKFSKIDVLVNNASIAIDTLASDKQLNDFKRVLDVNLLGTFLMTKYVSKNMLDYKSGKIINIASTNGVDTYYPEGLDYDASKAGVISLTKNYAKELAPYINVNAVAPGWINTPMNKELSSEFKNKELEGIYLSRFGEPEEVANLVSFLSSDKASYITGEVIRVDGGSNHV